MLTLRSGRPAANCQGATRRAALRAGVLGFGGLALADALRARAAAPEPARKKACILIWLDGGPSHLETFDPKPDAPAEVRGPFGVAKTRLPGVVVSALMPETAKRLDKVALVRSVRHGTGDHFAAAHWVATGRFGATAANLPQQYPSAGAVVARVKGPNAPGLPAYVGLPAAETVYLFPGYMGAAYLGGAYAPVDADREAKYLGHADGRPVRPPKWLAAGPQSDALAGRAGLLRRLDGLRRDLDASPAAGAMDRYQRQAVDLVLGGRAREAFDLDKEPAKAAARYGPGPWGRYTLMARRLVEAGVTFVTVDMPHWDDHASIEKGHGAKVPAVDRALGALLDDLSDRGMLGDVLVAVMGEFGRTPRLNKGLPGGDPVPGRDHWGDAFSVLLAGGGLAGGAVVGRTTARGEYPADRPVGPADVLATIYHVLGVDPRRQFPDRTGRPVAVLDDGEPIRELVTAGRVSGG